MHYTLCDMICDIAQNSVEAKASNVTLECIQDSKWLKVIVSDNGKGMSPEAIENSKSPFYTDGLKHPNRKIGLGIPFLIQTVEETEGKWSITSKEGQGTTISMEFNLKNIDTPPVGNISNLFETVLTLPGNFDMDIHRVNFSKNLDYVLKKNEIIDALGGEMESASSLLLLKKYVESQEQSRV